MKAFLFVILSFWLETIHVIHPHEADFQPIFFSNKETNFLLPFKLKTTYSNSRNAFSI